MNNKLVIFFILVCQTGFGQTLVDRNTFEGIKNLKVLSTETIEKKNQRAALKLKFIDYTDNTIKYYEAELSKNEFVSIKNNRFLFSALPSISVMTVPFKVREKNRQGFVTAKADIKNIGLYFPLALWDRKRYWIDNSTSTHKFSLGFLIAPMTEELSDKNTNNFFNNSNISYSAFMLSTSLACTYTYKSITFAFIPLGMDFGLDEAGKNWDNHSNFWVGFGIGIDTKLFGF
jgi:hypothetical protein